MPTTGLVEQEVAGRPTERQVPVVEHPAVGRRHVVARPGRPTARCRAPATTGEGSPAFPVSCGSWWNIGHAPVSLTVGTVDSLHLVVLDDSLVARVVARDGDPDGAVGVVGHQRRVLERQARALAQRGDQGAGLPVEDLHAGRGGHDGVLVPAPGEIGADDRADDLSGRGRVPDRGSR